MIGKALVGLSYVAHLLVARTFGPMVADVLVMFVRSFDFARKNPPPKSNS